MPPRDAVSPAGRALLAWGDPLGDEAGTRLGTLLFLLVVGVVAFWDLGARSLHTLDLPRFGVLAREMIRDGDWLVPHRYGEIYANKPPLLIWLIAFPSLVVGEVTPFLVRLPSALGLVLMALAASAWGRMRTGSPAAGRAAALLLVGTFVITRFGREGRPDMLASGLTVMATFLLDRAAMGRAHRGDVGWAGLLLGLALLAKGPALLVFPLLVLLLPSQGRATRARLRSARPHLVLLLALAVAALWFVPAVLHAGWDYGRTLLLDQATERIGGAANHEEPAAYYFTRLVDSGAPWTPLYLAAVLLIPGKPLRGTRSLLGAGLLSLALFSLFPTKHVRYVLPVYALLAVGAGWLVVRYVLAWRARRWESTLYLLGGALAAAGAFALLVVGVRTGAAVPLLLPAAGLLALTASAYGWRRTLSDDAHGARRRLVGSLVVAVALLLSSFWIVRDRHRVRAREAFDRAVGAAVLGDAPLYTVAPVLPDDVFYGAPEARLAREAGDLPAPEAAPTLQVLVPQALVGDVRRVRREEGHVLLRHDLSDDGPVVLLMRFGAR